VERETKATVEGVEVTVETDVVVPKMPGGRLDERLDLGTIELKPAKPRR
jgi:hypothetical protein